jgi:hypothetical protein
MPYDPLAVLRRDQHRCRLRFPECRTRATRVILNIAEYAGGTNTDDNALAACGHCWGMQQQQRARAAQLFAA